MHERSTDEEQVKKRAKTRISEGDADIFKVEEFLCSIEKSDVVGVTKDASISSELKPTPSIYFDVVRGDDNKLLGRLDLSGVTQLTFGREASRVDVVLEHASISRHHATMTFDTNTAFISDFRSTHGTFLRYFFVHFSL